MQNVTLIGATGLFALRFKKAVKKTEYSRIVALMIARGARIDSHKSLAYAARATDANKPTDRSQLLKEKEPNLTNDLPTRARYTAMKIGWRLVRRCLPSIASSITSEASNL
jgi:hypothetical protein